MPCGILPLRLPVCTHIALIYMSNPNPLASPTVLGTFIGVCVCVCITSQSQKLEVSSMGAWPYEAVNSVLMRGKSLKA